MTLPPVDETQALRVYRVPLRLWRGRQLVRTVDFVSTCAANREVAPMLFTELCVMRYDRMGRQWRLESLAPDQTVDAVAAPAEDGREIALTHRGRAVMQSLGLWQHLPPGEVARIQPDVWTSSPSRQSSHGSCWGRPSSPTSSSAFV